MSALGSKHLRQRGLRPWVRQTAERDQDLVELMVIAREVEACQSREQRQRRSIVPALPEGASRCDAHLKALIRQGVPDPRECGIGAEEAERIDDDSSEIGVGVIRKVDQPQFAGPFSDEGLGRRASLRGRARPKHQDPLLHVRSTQVAGAT